MTQSWETMTSVSAGHIILELFRGKNLFTNGLFHEIKEGPLQAEEAAGQRAPLSTTRLFVPQIGTFKRFLYMLSLF